MKRSEIFIRLMIGLIFLSEGIQKFLFADTLGAGRFVKLGIPFPDVLGPFVGAVEVVCGSLIAFGILPGLSAIPLLCVILVAIGTTKVPMLIEKGFWPTAHDGRADFAMLMGILYFIFAHLKSDFFRLIKRSPSRTHKPK